MTDDTVDKIRQLHEKKNKEWAKFREITLKNLDGIELAVGSSKEKCKQYEATIENIKELSKTARSKSYVKVCSLAYVEAFVQHTGEYNVNLGPDYQATLTKEQTVEYLEEQLAGERSALSMFKAEREQLQRRLGYDFTEADDIPDVSDMPESILSDKGMAFKRGNFFEIIEEDDVPCSKGKRVSRLRTKVDKELEEIRLDQMVDVNEKVEEFLDSIKF